ncbi:MAG: hypothetical protein DRP45_04415 [Candidatus Zixiibacteriota bacterium]|nr:MAG: hypothetical protein DRP45_04415 [candidate division Zixibacteria bacterium]
MNATISAAVDSYRINTASFEQALDNIPADDTFHRPMDKGNTVNFVAGHMVASRYLVANVVGLKDEFAFGNLYDRGAKVTDNSAYPSLDEIKKAWNDITPKLMKRLEEATTEELSAKPPFEVPYVENTVGGIVSFLAWHESTHIGQLAYLGRLYGDTQLFG